MEISVDGDSTAKCCRGNVSMSDNPGIKVRPVTPELIRDFIEWTGIASMFLSSPEGAAFGQELRAVFELALAKSMETGQ